MLDSLLYSNKGASLASLTVRDVLMLWPGQRLNDTILHYCLGLTIPSNAYLVSSLVSGDARQVSKVLQSRVSHSRHLVIPFFNKVLEHWSVAILRVSRSKKSITAWLFDSLGSTNSPSLDRARVVLEHAVAGSSQK